MRKICILALALIMGSCIGSDPNFRVYVAAHRLQHNVQAPDYWNYVKNDATRDPALKETIKGRLDAEEQMITAAELALGLKVGN